MSIRWGNVFALFLVVFALVVLIRNASAVGAFLATMKEIGPGHTPEEQTKGLLALGLVLVAIFAAMRISIRNGKGKDDDR